ncbi:hypothetical protein AC1031_009202 [Aphanomyces cochlioides]|nr:hypothetical protein AC1031_009202 [Aphanomyces cochlioides]
MTSKQQLKCMVEDCGTIIWYTIFPTHMKNRHKEIPENRHIRLMWGRPVLEDGSLAPYTPRRSAGVKPQYALPPSNSIGQNVSSGDDDQTTNGVTTLDDEDDLVHDIMREGKVVKSILRLLIFQTKSCGGNPRDILAPLLTSQGSNEGMTSPAQSSGTNADVNDEEETKEETNHQDVDSTVRPSRQKKRRSSAERVAKMVRMLS